MRTLEQTDTISREDKALLREVREVVRRFIPAATVLLYGSVARGTQNPESDYDILVLTDQPMSSRREDKARDVVYDIQLERDVLISTQFYARQEWNMPLRRVSPFYKEVERDAVRV